jgi:hypothetical protein
MGFGEKLKNRENLVQILVEDLLSFGCLRDFWKVFVV